MSILGLVILAVLLLIGAGVFLLIKIRHRKSALPAVGRGARATGSGPLITQAVACAGCDYNLYGLASDGQCSECGCPIHISIPTAAPPAGFADEAGALDTAVPCVGCGNDLRGSRRHQLCPTCDAPAWFTLPTLLRHSDPAWLCRVRSGMTLWLWNMLITFVLSALAGIFTLIWTFQVSGNVTRTSMLGSSLAETVAVILSMLVVWRITLPNPALKNRDVDAKLRQVTRAGAIIALVSALGVILFLLSELPKVYMYFCSIIGVGGWVSFVGLFLYLRDFACRIPDRKFIRSITVIMWWLCSATFIFQILGIGHIWYMDLDSTPTPVASSADTPAPPTPVASSSVAVSTQMTGNQAPLGYNCSTGVVALVTVGFTIWLVVMLFRLRAAFRSALDDAERVAAVEQT